MQVDKNARKVNQRDKTLSETIKQRQYRDTVDKDLKLLQDSYQEFLLAEQRNVTGHKRS